MDFAKKIYQKLAPKLVFLYLVVFPFGQLFRLNFNIGVTLPIIISDLLVLCFILFYFFGGVLKPRSHKIFFSFFVITIFSSILAPQLFRLTFPNILVGFLYLIRVFAYYTFFVVVLDLVSSGLIPKRLLLNSLILISFFVSLFGWIQYFWIPDLTSLKYIGWDDHLHRLVGTYLDPGFTGIILGFGFLLSSNLYLREKKRKFLLLSVLFLTSIMFTYSRASILATFIGLSFLLTTYKKKYLIFIALLIFLVFIPFLPRSKGEGVRFERMKSINARLNNYRETLAIIKKYPLFGVGFNNICEVRISMFGGERTSHACGGSDSSLLFLGATTGIIGLLNFLHIVFKSIRNLDRRLYGNFFLACFASLSIHSLFVNSLFYPWVMGYMGILLALSTKS